MARSWRKQDYTYLKRYAERKNLEELVRRFNTTTDDVKDKLEELKIQTLDGYGYREPYVDPALSVFEDALKAFHEKKWARARSLFEKVVAESEFSDIAARAQVYLAAEVQRQTAAKAGEADPYLEAVAAKNSGDLETALEICSRGGRTGKDEKFTFLAASIQSLLGQTEEALEMLKSAIEMEPENRIHAFHDSDFEPLRESEEFEELTATPDA